MDLKSALGTIFKQGAVKAIEILVLGGSIALFVRGGINRASTGIDKRISLSEARIIQHTDKADSATISNSNAAIQAILCKMEDLDSTIKKSNNPELNRLRRENWNLLKDKYDLLNEKKKTSLFLDSNLYQLRLIASGK